MGLEWVKDPVSGVERPPTLAEAGLASYYAEPEDEAEEVEEAAEEAVEEQTEEAAEADDSYIPEEEPEPTPKKRGRPRKTE